MAIKGLTKQGDLIDRDQPGAAFVVDPDEPGADKFIESVRNQAARERIENTDEAAAAHMSIEGRAVPMSPNDDESPEDKLHRLEAEGVLPPRGIVATTQGFKTGAEIQTMGVVPSLPPAPPIPPNPNPPAPLVQDPPVQDPLPLSADEQALEDEFGKRIADVMLSAGYHSRAALEAASDATLIAVKGIGPDTVKKIRHQDD